MVGIMCRLFSILLLAACAALPNLSAGKVGETVRDVGTFIDLEDGNRLQVYVEDNQIFACFVDAEDIIIASPAESIVFVVSDTRHKEEDWRTLLEPVDEAILTSSRRFHGPYDFRARIIIRFTEGEPSSFTNLPVDLEKNM